MGSLEQRLSFPSRRAGALRLYQSSEATSAPDVQMSRKPNGHRKPAPHGTGALLNGAEAEPTSVQVN